MLSPFDGFCRALLLCSYPKEHFPRFSVGKGGKSMKRRIVCLAVCMLAVLLPLRALAAGETGAGVRTDAGDWKSSRSAMPGEALHFRASLTLRAGESWTVRSVFSPGVEFLSLIAVLADGESVNASYYTLITGARSPENAFTLHLSERFSARESACLTVEWTARLGDGFVTGAEGNAVSLMAESVSGRTVTSGSATVFSYGFSVFRGVRFADARVADHPLPSACFRLYYDAAAREPVAFRECGDAYLACALDCGHIRHTYILRTAESGRLNIGGLPAGTYYLQETRPPSGYGCAADALRVTLTEDGTLETDAPEVSGSTLLLLETAQETLPEDKTLTFYRRGCGVMAMLFTTVLCGKRRYL